MEKTQPSKGQVTVPKPMPPSRLDDVVGFLRYKGKPKSLRQMESAIAAEVRARRSRGRY
jgi:hypothetical protein